MSQKIYTQYDNKREILLSALYWLRHITVVLINPKTAPQHLYKLYINIHSTAVQFILRPSIMSSSRFFGISYEDDFFGLPRVSRCSA